MPKIIRDYKTGRILRCTDYITRSDLDRFFDFVDMIPFHECWEWRGAKDKDGYGYFWANKKTTRAHRFALTLREPINKDLVIDHICKNRNCVNPAHLRQVTQAFNVLENSNGLAAANRAKTHCKLGHEFTQTNTARDKKGGRLCRKCACIKTKRSYEKRKNLITTEAKAIQNSH